MGKGDALHSSMYCTYSVHCTMKRYFKIDQHLARYFVYNVECLSSHPPFLCSQIITPLLTSMISTNQEKGLEFYSCSSVEFLLYNVYIQVVSFLRESETERDRDKERDRKRKRKIDTKRGSFRRRRYEERQVDRDIDNNLEVKIRPERRR